MTDWVSIAGGLVATSAALGGALVVRSVARLRPAPRLVTIPPAAVLVGLAALAFAVRLVVEPVPTNWYTEISPPGGPVLMGKYGVVANLGQAALWRVLPWDDRSLFAANALVGALAVPCLMVIAAQCGLRRPAQVAAGLMLCLLPVHVQVSASASEHVLATTITLTLLVAWLHGQRQGSWLGRAFALSLLPVVALVRVDAWPQTLGVVALGTAVTGSGRGAWRAVVAFVLVWMLAGAMALALLHDGGAVAESAGLVPRLMMVLTGVPRLAYLALRPPMWLSPAVALLAVVGGIRLWRDDRRLLGGVAVWCALPWLGIGWGMTDLINSRYYLGVFAIVVLVAAHGCSAVIDRWERSGYRVATWLAPRGAQRTAPRAAPRRALQAGILQAGILAILLVAPAIPAWSFRYTFQQEYRFLRRELARLPDGCVVTQLPVAHETFSKDLDAALDAPRSSLVAAYPRLVFTTVESLEELGQLDSSCVAYYQTAACSLGAVPEVEERIPEARPYYEARCAPLAGAPWLTRIASEEVVPRGLAAVYGDEPVGVALYRSNGAAR